ncbi:MAG: lamin tail domain-containing protein [Anaerolineae bacterium]|nr:lamin tail domain-containing protein [Anaerolineae bacterium]
MFRRVCWLLVAILLPFVLLGGIGQVEGMMAYSQRETAVSAPPHFAVDEVQNASTTVLIEAVHYYGYDGANDEAVSLINVSNQVVNVGGWQLSDGTATAVLPQDLSLSPGQVVWLANSAAAFKQQFGHAPDAAKTITGFSIPLLSGLWPGYANDGDEVLLSDATMQLVDTLVYKAGAINTNGWTGTAVQPYAPHTALPATGQILYRMRDQQTGLPVPDTNTATDWAQATGDVINGRKVRYPGWDLDEFFFTAQVTETAVLTIAIAPDNAYQAIVTEINNAAQTIQVEVQTVENHSIGDALVQAGNRGVTVTLLLEGQVTGQTGKISDDERYICQQIEATGGACYFMISDSASNIQDRYAYLHAKFMLFDGQRALISSENLSPNSLPADDKSDGTWGRRGVVLITDAPGVVSHLQTIFARDLDVANHVDLVRWQTSDATYGAPPAWFVPITETGGITYTVRYPTVTAVSAEFPFEIIQSPENSLRNQDGLLGLVNRAGEGDTVLVQQLSERPFWGASASNPTADPNPRLEAYINAARRGARVRILLDEYFDTPSDPNSNAVTCANITNIAAQERLKLTCALANPTGLGIHNKMVLAQIDGLGYIHVGSINGTETASKINRELALQLQSNEAYALLADMFDHDWPYRIYLPSILNNVHGPADHILISEIQYNPPGLDDDEFVELVNPTSLTIDISGYGLGDAVNKDDFEDVRRFPAGTQLAPREVIVVTISASAFFDEFNTYPDFEILETVTAVPNLIDDPTWGNPAATFQLGNTGDEVLLRNKSDKLIDSVVYGTGSYPGVTSCPLVIVLGAVLERIPYWQDTDNCSADFREWPYPNPGTVQSK